MNSPITPKILFLMMTFNIQAIKINFKSKGDDHMKNLFKKIALTLSLIVFIISRNSFLTQAATAKQLVKSYKATSTGGTVIRTDYYFYDSTTALKFADSISVSNSVATAQYVAAGLTGLVSTPGGFIVGGLFLIDSNARNSLASKIRNTVYKSRKIHIQVVTTKGANTVSSTTVKSWDGKTVSYSYHGMKLITNKTYY